MKKLLESVLKNFAIDTLRRYQPIIIGVTGSIGKTSTKEAIFSVLNSKFKVRRNVKNYNNEIGVPLTILGLDSGGRSPIKWLTNFLKTIKTNYLLVDDYPEVLILEMGADKPGDIKYLMSFIDPNIGVITGIGEIPVHVEFFKTPVQVAREKAKLIEFLKEDDFAILNFDDERVKNLANKTKAKILGYGFGEDCQVKAKSFELNIFPDIERCGINFKIEYEGKVVSVKKEGFFGQHQVYPMLGGVAVGLAMGMNLLEATKGLEQYQSPPGRLKLIEGIKHTWIIDDSYNASPPATAAALETLARFEGRRHLAVLGDMLELGEFTEEAHVKIGEKFIECADLFFGVGERMRFAVEAAKVKKKARQKVFWFETTDGARLPLQKTIQKGDVILVKGSQSMRMEKIVEEIMAEPQRARELLVRQEEIWKK